MTVSPRPLDLHARLTNIVDRYAYACGTNGPADTAWRILGEPVIAEALAALPVLEQLRAQHQPRRWAADSTAVSCSCGAGNCGVAETLTQAAR